MIPVAQALSATVPLKDIQHYMRPGTLRLPVLPPLSLYVHLPWCLRKCPYCDFNSHEFRAGGEAGELPEQRYIDALVADLEASLPDPSVIDVEAHLTAREELRRVQAGLDGLPARCRQVVTLRRIEGLTTREVAERMNISVSTVEQQMVHGMRALADFLAGGSGRVRRVPVRSRAVMSEPGS